MLTNFLSIKLLDFFGRVFIFSSCFRDSNGDQGQDNSEQKANLLVTTRTTMKPRRAKTLTKILIACTTCKIQAPWSWLSSAETLLEILLWRSGWALFSVLRSWYAWSISSTFLRLFSQNSANRYAYNASVLGTFMVVSRSMVKFSWINLRMAAVNVSPMATRDKTILTQRQIRLLRPRYLMRLASPWWMNEHNVRISSKGRSPSLIHKKLMTRKPTKPRKVRTCTACKIQ